MKLDKEETTIAKDTATQTKWAEYLKNTQNKPPRGIVKKFVTFLNPSEQVASKTHVVDVGCGAGNDTRFYNKVGFKVTAVDNNQSAIHNLEANTAYKDITVKVSDITLEPIPQCDIASASYCLPFVPPSLFKKTWNEHIVQSILPGGYFVGHFLGVEDDWAASYKDSMTFLTENQVRELFNSKTCNFEELSYFKEKKKGASLANGGSKHWHIFTVFARKKNINTENENNASQNETLNMAKP